MLTPILIGLAVIILVFVVVVAAQPTDFRITRKALISATPSTVFAQVNDLPKWQEWSPWAKLDPNAKMTYQGPSSGPGAGYTWSGNNKVGEGRMTIMESRPSELVRLRLEFLFHAQQQFGKTLYLFHELGVISDFAKLSHD